MSYKIFQRLRGVTLSCLIEVRDVVPASIKHIWVDQWDLSATRTENLKAIFYLFLNYYYLIVLISSFI